MTRGAEDGAGDDGEDGVAAGEGAAGAEEEEGDGGRRLWKRWWTSL